MAIVVIGGHSRNVGKTSVVAGLIAALPKCDWTAFKITQFGHAGHPAGHAPSEEIPWRITQEYEGSGRSDTSRFLAAGARAALLVETEEGRLHEAMPAIQEKLAESANSIIESNSILEFLRPDLYLVVLDPAIKDFKSSAQRYFDRADAVLLHDGGIPQWQAVAPGVVAACPTFRISLPRYVGDDLIAFVSKRLPFAPSGLL